MQQTETIKKYDTYKDSGIEWIGEIPQEWKFAKLARCSNFVNGYAFNSENMDIEGEVPVVRIGDIQNNRVQYETCLKVDSSEELKPYELKVNDIVIAMSGATTGKLAVICDEKQAYINQRVGIIRSKYNKFIRYCLDNESFMQYVALLSAGSAQPNISMGNILDYKIPYISVEEQQRIAGYLDKKCGEIDRVIETEKAVIEKLKEYKQSIITEAVTKGLDKSVPLKDSGIEWIGKIPQNWEVLKFSNIAKVKSNLVNPNEYLSYYQISPENIEKDTGNLLNNFGTVEESGVISGNHLFFKGQILYSKIRPNLNKVIIAPFDGLCSADMYPIETDINTNYFLYSMLSDTFVSQVKLFIENRVKMPKINQNELSNIYIAVPNDSNEQQQIAEYLDKKCSEIDKAIADKEQVIEKFTEYKKSLIYECVTGKRKVVE